MRLVLYFALLVFSIIVVSEAHHSAGRSLRSASTVRQGIRVVSASRTSHDKIQVTLGLKESDSAIETTKTFYLVRDDQMFSADASIATDLKGVQSLMPLSTEHTYILIGSGEWASVTVESEGKDGKLTVSGGFSSPILGQDVVYLAANADGTAHTVRRLQDIEDLQDVTIETPEHKEQRLARTAQMQSADSLLRTAGDSNIFFPGCYPGDSAPLSVSIGMVTDAGFLERINTLYPTTSNTTQQQINVQREVERSLSIVRPLYLVQLNVQLQLSNLIVGTTSSNVGLFRSRPGVCPSDPLSALSQFSDWARVSAPGAAHWHLLTDCYPSGIVGAGYIGGLCSAYGSHVAFSSYSNSLWLTVAHEIGHVFGAHHTFYFGQGGIMDYGDGRLYGGAVQFHPDNREEMCFEISSVLQATCKYVTISSQLSVCGNGVLEPSEDCECVTSPTSVSCGACKNCKLASPKQCSTAVDGYVVRQSSTPAFISTSDVTLVAHPDCCSQGVLKGRSCNSGRDVCSATGYCKKACATFFLSPCGFDDTGCIQKCLLNNVCLGSELTTLGPPPIPAGAVPDGLACPLNGVPGRGVCQTGVCISPATKSPDASSVDGVTLSPATLSTAQPTSQLPSSQPTPEPTLSPTLAPTLLTTTPTLRATLAPTPIPCPDEQSWFTCNAIGSATACNKAKCSWCVSMKKCQAVKGICGLDWPAIGQIYAKCPPFTPTIEIG